jgi:serine/threonine protein kinase
VQVVDFREEPLPQLLMPYFPLGNLEDQHELSRITEEETISLLFQGLEVFKYLHPHGVTHRDIKPANILVEFRDPLPFSIKLADFGLAKVAKDDSKLKTVCGTPLYSAPEIYCGKDYSPAVDIWSLGVVVFNYAFGLRRQAFEERRENPVKGTKEWCLSWCQYIVEQVNDWEDPDRLIDLLKGMLRIDPEKRHPADECLKKGYNLRLFYDDRTFDTGSATPTQQTAQQGDISDDDGATTIILENLWVPGELSSYEDNHRTMRRSFGVASQQWGDNSIQESVESRRRKTDHNASVSWTLALQSGLGADEEPDLRIIWPNLGNSENEFGDIMVQTIPEANFEESSSMQDIARRLLAAQSEG